MNNKIIKELNRRVTSERFKKDRYEIIGAEIRNKRLESFLTLEGVSVDICSPSYVCKIEKSQIEPNQHMLREICDRLDVSQEKFQYLYDLKDILNDVISAYLFGNESKIEKLFSKGKGLTNYRYSIINFIYYIFKKDFSNASIIYKHLVGLVPTMLETDLTMFGLFSGIYYYYTFNFEEAIENFEILKKFQISDEAIILKAIYQFRANYALNNTCTPIYYLEMMKLLNEKRYNDLIEREGYIIALYYLKNKCMPLFEEELSKLHNQVSVNSLLVIKSFVIKEYNNLTSLAKEKLNIFAKLLVNIFKNRSYVKEEMSKIKDDYYRYDFDYLYLEYQLKSIDEKSNYILYEAIPKLKLTNEGFWKDYFLKQIAKINDGTGKYKYFVKAYSILYPDEIEFFEEEE